MNVHSADARPTKASSVGPVRLDDDAITAVSGGAIYIPWQLPLPSPHPAPPPRDNPVLPPGYRRS
ncbi:MAG: hypothetical protein R3D62_00105 [Xanthobacteraceae bacterium]